MVMAMVTYMAMVTDRARVMVMAKPTKRNAFGNVKRNK